MQRTEQIGTTAFLCLLFTWVGPGVFAQTWSVEEKEILKTMEEMRQAIERKDIEGFMSFIHEDFSGWGTVSTLPTDKEFRRKSLSGTLQASDAVIQKVTPLVITIHGDVSVVHSHAVTILKEKEPCKERTRNTFWTDVYVREGGRWLLIADHGRLLE